MLSASNCMLVLITATSLSGAISLGASIARPSNVNIFETFWRERLPETVKMPEFLQQKISPLDVEAMEVFAMQLATIRGALNLRVQEFCTSAKLLCNQEVPITSAASSSYGSTPSALEVAGHLFFSASKLRTGGYVTLPALDDPTSDYAMLPRVLANKMPFSSKSLSLLKRMFHVSPSSNMSYMMDITMAWCNTTHQDDVGQCFTSLEDIVETAVSKLGSNITILGAPPNMVAVQSVQMVKLESQMGSTSSLTCHGLVFPFGVYYCHQLNHTKAYKAWVRPPLSQKNFLSPVLCHTFFNHDDKDTNTACHFLYGGQFTWMPN